MLRQEQKHTLIKFNAYCFAMVTIFKANRPQCYVIRILPYCYKMHNSVFHIKEPVVCQQQQGQTKVIRTKILKQQSASTVLNSVTSPSLPFHWLHGYYRATKQLSTAPSAMPPARLAISSITQDSTFEGNHPALTNVTTTTTTTTNNNNSNNITTPEQT